MSGAMLGPRATLRLSRRQPYENNQQRSRRSTGDSIANGHGLEKRVSDYRTFTTGLYVTNHCFGIFSKILALYQVEVFFPVFRLADRRLEMRMVDLTLRTAAVEDRATVIKAMEAEMCLSHQLRLLRSLLPLNSLLPLFQLRVLSRRHNSSRSRLLKLLPRLLSKLRLLSSRTTTIITMAKMGMGSSRTEMVDSKARTTMEADSSSITITGKVRIPSIETIITAKKTDRLHRLSSIDSPSSKEETITAAATDKALKAAVEDRRLHSSKIGSNPRLHKATGTIRAIIADKAKLARLPLRAVDM